MDIISARSSGKRTIGRSVGGPLSRPVGRSVKIGRAVGPVDRSVRSIRSVRSVRPAGRSVGWPVGRSADRYTWKRMWAGYLGRENSPCLPRKNTLLFHRKYTLFLPGKYFISSRENTLFLPGNILYYSTGKILYYSRKNTLLLPGK